MYMSELVVSLLRQMRAISPFDHEKDHFVPYEINNRRKSKFVTRKIDRTQLQGLLSKMLSSKPNTS